MPHPTFTVTRRNGVEYFRCRQTGVVYSLEGPVIRNSGRVVAHRNERKLAVDYIEQSARLDMLPA